MIRKREVSTYDRLLVLEAVLMLVALYLIFIFAPTEIDMGDIQRIFYVHVPLAWVAFLAFFVVLVGSVQYLRRRDMKWDVLAHASAEIGVVFTTLVLITGPIWARPVWGEWWAWDPRLTTTLIMWMTYVGYLLVRSFAVEESMGARFAAVVGIVGFANVPLVYLSVSLWRTQHPPHLVSTLEWQMALTLMVSLVAFTILYALLLYRSVSIHNLERRLRAARRRIEDKEIGFDGE